MTCRMIWSMVTREPLRRFKERSANGEAIYKDRIVAREPQVGGGGGGGGVVRDSLARLRDAVAEHLLEPVAGGFTYVAVALRPEHEGNLKHTVGAIKVKHSPLSSLYVLIVRPPRRCRSRT